MTGTSPRSDRSAARRARDDTPPAGGPPKGDSVAAGREARVVQPGLRTCLEQELENLWRLLRYRGLESRFADQVGALDEAVRAALEEGSQTLSLSALRTISALTTEVNREPSKRVASR